MNIAAGATSLVSPSTITGIVATWTGMFVVPVTA